MTTFNLDATRFHAELDRIKARYGPASAEAARYIADSVVDKALATWPRDTNRSAAAWIEAANQAGLTARTAPAIRRSARHEVYIAALERQYKQAERLYRYWERFDKLYRRDGRTNQWYYRRKVLPGLRAAEKRMSKAVEQLQAAATEGFLFFDRGGLLYGEARWTKRHALQRLTTVRTKFYGGRGRMIAGDGKSVVELTNMEPHARIVERVARHGHPFRSAMMSLRGTGMRKVGKTFVAGLETSLAQTA